MATQPAATAVHRSGVSSTTSTFAVVSARSAGQSRAMPRRLALRFTLGLLVGLWSLAAACGPPAFAAGDDDWRWPLDGPPEIGRPFQPPATPYGPGHRGVDLVGTPSAIVRAAGSGTVGYAGVLAGRGVVTVVHPDGRRTTYEPVAATVAVGDLVVAGDPIGHLEAGHAGCQAAACLHWGLRRGDAYLDPLSLVGGGEVRLYPRFGSAPEPFGSGRAPPDRPTDGPSGAAVATDTEVDVEARAATGSGGGAALAGGIAAAVVVTGAGAVAGRWVSRAPPLGVRRG